MLLIPYLIAEYVPQRKKQGVSSPVQFERFIMKMKTHSGAKKRLRLLKSGKVKRKQVGVRHLNSHMKSKNKRHLGQTAFVSDANMLQIKRCLVF